MSPEEYEFCMKELFSSEQYVVLVRALALYKGTARSIEEDVISADLMMRFLGCLPPALCDATIYELKQRERYE